ncbi:hypothetical protein FACS1894208_03240 [Clostridia bacterium]|nr:hypothetical protein FACS1894208_03240 [Clostridia bacterium]
MKKQVLSVALVLAMVLSLVSYGAAASDVIHYESAPGIIRIYSDMTEEEAQLAFVNGMPTDAKTLTQSLEGFLGDDAYRQKPETITQAKEITKNCKSDYEKLQAIHDWVAENIWYDWDTYESGEYQAPDYKFDPVTVLKNRRAVCSGYAFLSYSMLIAVGIPAAYFVGNGKYGGGYTEKDRHAWNAAFVDGRWIQFDATWDSGNVWIGGKKQNNTPYPASREWFDTKTNTLVWHKTDDGVYPAVNFFTLDNALTYVDPHEDPLSTNDIHLEIPYGVISVGTIASEPTEYSSDGMLPNYALRRIKSVVIPDTVKTIGDYWFLGVGADTLTIPNNVTAIGRWAFSGSALKSIVIPDSVTEMGEGAFRLSRDLAKVTLSAKLTKIEDDAFIGCYSLREIKIPPSVKSIGDISFAHCNNLERIYIPSSVTYISDSAFLADTRMSEIGKYTNMTPINVVIYGQKGSYAERYAADRGIKFAVSDGAFSALNSESAAAWARDGINSAVAKGFVPIDLQDKYANVITRQEFCRMAVRFVEYKTGKTINAVLREKGLSVNSKWFSDSADSAILAAYALGITSGTVAPTDTAPGLFSPNGQFTREQAATMIMNACKVLGMDTRNPPASDFTDLSTASSWAVGGINFVRANGIMGGTSTTEAVFTPKTNYTRQESIVTFDSIK